MLSIRKELPKDYDSVRNVNDLAFNQPAEGKVVDKIRENCQDIISLVAEYDGKIVGHILFSPVQISYKDSIIQGMGLAPMAVLPEYQKQGIGSNLINEGIRKIKETDCPFIIVLGHEHYYPKFGFEKASIYNLRAQWEGIPDEAFMVMILNETIMRGISGVVEYRHEFNEAM